MFSDILKERKIINLPPYKDVKITVYVDLPWHSEPIAKCIDIEARHIGECLKPLPRDREILPESAREAIHQTMQRTRLINLVSGELAEDLTKAILEAIESRDPQNGYSPEEWKRISQPSD